MVSWASNCVQGRHQTHLSVHISSMVLARGVKGLILGRSRQLVPWAPACTGRVSGKPHLRAASTSTSGISNEPPSAQAHIVVFGGRGFVGSHILQEVLNMGLAAVSISRSGTPPAREQPWMQQVEWMRGDALDPQSYKHLLQGALAAISTVGGFGSQDQMLKVNGAANIAAIKAAHEAGVPRFVYISAHIPNIPGIETLLRGYVQGKQQAEAALQQHYPTGGVALRPSIIYGNRVISSSMTLPLQYVFQPLETVLQRVPNTKQLSQLPFLGAVATPPVDVKLLARAAVRAATDPSVPSGVIDCWDIPTYGK